MAGETLANVTEAARLEAERRGHREATVEHLVLHALSVPEVVARLMREMVSVTLVREQLDARLAAAPTGKGYRDGSRAELGAEARAVVDAARSRGLLRLLRKEGDRLASSIFEHESTSNILRAAEWDETAVRRFSARAANAARKRGHTNVLSSHALLGLVDDARFAEALEAIGADVAEVRSNLDRIVVRGHRSSKLASPEELLTLASVKANVLQRRTLEVDVLVVDLLRNAPTQKVLSQVGVSSFDLLGAYVHRAPRQISGAAEGDLEVVFFDDDFTTQEAVVHVLRDVFEHEESRARALMLEVHRQGSAVVAVLDANDARARLDRALDWCRDRMMPLRIVTRPAP